MIDANPQIIWLTGISGSGKSTIAQALFNRFELSGRPVVILDGDQVREFFEGDLGYDRRERILNVRRIGFAALLLAQQNINVIVSNIAPYYKVREFLRKKLSPYYFQVYLKVSIDTVKKRDVKGLYEKFEKGEIENLVGLDDPYDIPRNPHLMLDTGKENLEESMSRIIESLKQQRSFIL